MFTIHPSSLILLLFSLTGGIRQPQTGVQHNLFFLNFLHYS